MEATLWIKIEGKKSYGRWKAGGVHAYKTKPSTESDEVAVRVTLEIPDSIFEEPVFEAKVTLPESPREFPTQAEVAQNLESVLSERMGFRVKVDMGEQPQPKAVSS